MALEGTQKGDQPSLQAHFETSQFRSAPCGPDSCARSHPSPGPHSTASPPAEIGAWRVLSIGPSLDCCPCLTRSEGNQQTEQVVTAARMLVGTCAKEEETKASPTHLSRGVRVLMSCLTKRGETFKTWSNGKGQNFWWTAAMGSKGNQKGSKQLERSDEMGP